MSVYGRVFFIMALFWSISSFFLKNHKNELMIPNIFLPIFIHLDYHKEHHQKKWNRSGVHLSSYLPSKWGSWNELTYSVTGEREDSSVYIAILPACYLSETFRYCLYTPKQLFCLKKKYPIGVRNELEIPLKFFIILN